MNPGAVEEIGKTARGVVRILDSQPMAVAMIVSNFILLGYLFYSGIENNKMWERNNEHRVEIGKLIIQAHHETELLLARCVVPPPRED